MAYVGIAGHKKQRHWSDLADRVRHGRGRMG